MILHVDTELPQKNLSTCTVTLIGPDLAITAGHCMPDLDLVASASVIFGYQTNCDGTRPAGYSPQVCKVIRTVKQRYADGTQFDYWVVQLKVPAEGSASRRFNCATTCRCLGNRFSACIIPMAR